MENLENVLSLFIIIATIVFNVPMILNIVKKENKDETMLKIIKSIGLIFLTFMLFTIILMPIDFFIDLKNNIKKNLLILLLHLFCFKKRAK